VLQGDPRFTHTYYNMSNGTSVRGPWNQGQGPWGAGESWTYIADPIAQTLATQGQLQQPITGTAQTQEQVAQINRELGQLRSQEIKAASPSGPNQWSDYTPNSDTAAGAQSRAAGDTRREPPSPS